jgi:hypothetical protein
MGQVSPNLAPLYLRLLLMKRVDHIISSDLFLYFELLLSSIFFSDESGVTRRKYFSNTYSYLLPSVVTKQLCFLCGVQVLCDFVES